MIPSERAEKPETHSRWKHGAIPVIGLIGGIGSGKSSVANLMASSGAAVIDADAVGHELLGDAEIRAAIVDHFGDVVLERPDSDTGPNPRIDRRALGKIVFADPAARLALEAILHPLMRARFIEDIESLVSRDSVGLVVLDAAILLEAGWDDLCDRVVFVDAPDSERLKRVKETRGWSEEMLVARERSQWPQNEKRTRADEVLQNDTSREQLSREVERLLSQLLAPVGPAEASFSPPIRSAIKPIADKLILDAPSPVGRMS